MAARTRSRFDDLDVKPANDAYTGLLALSLLAMIASCVILYLDYAQYGQTKAPAVNVPTPTRPGAPLPPPASAASPTSNTPVAQAPVATPIMPVAAAEIPSGPVLDLPAPALLPPELDGPELPKPGE